MQREPGEATADRSARIARAGTRCESFCKAWRGSKLPEEEHDVDEGALVAELDKMADDVESDDFYAD